MSQKEIVSYGCLFCPYRKLSSQAYVHINKMSRSDLKIHLRNKSGFKDIDENVNVTLEEAFDNFHKYAEPVTGPIENLLPSLESQLLRLRKREAVNKESKIECTLCKKKFVRFEDRHEHYLSDHTGVKAVVIPSVKKFECSICERSFNNWQGRHEHYMEVHAI